jgi:hypothetical protein
MQRVSSGHGSAIVGNLDSIVKRIQVDAIQDERHLGRVQPGGASCASCSCDERCCENGWKIDAEEELQFTSEVQKECGEVNESKPKGNPLNASAKTGRLLVFKEGKNSQMLAGSECKAADFAGKWRVGYYRTWSWSGW